MVHYTKNKKRAFVVLEFLCKNRVSKLNEIPYQTKLRRTKLSKFWGHCRKYCPSKNFVYRKFCPTKYFVCRNFVQPIKQHDICFDGTFDVITNTKRLTLLQKKTISFKDALYWD